MRTYVIDSDLADQRGIYLSVLLIISTLVADIGLILTAIANQPVLPFGFLFAALFLTYLLRRYKQMGKASWVFVLGLIVTPTLMLWMQDAQAGMGMYLLFFLPTALSVLVLPSSIRLVTTLTVLGMVIGALHHASIVPALVEIIAPVCIVICLSEVIQVVQHKNAGLLHWAIDSEQKNANRAEMYYRQGEELEQALLDLQHTKGKLELTNTQLAQAQARAEQASNAKSVFMSNMSHELRTPLNVIIGYTSSMLSMPQMYGNLQLPPVYHSDIELIKENGEYLVGLINDILDLSKIEAGKLELHPQSTSLADMLRGTIATSIGLLKDKPVQIVPDFPDVLPPVWADQMRVRQIILNLMSNAIKFTETGSVTLGARLDGDRVRISVTDTGIGIPEAILSTIFDRFEQAEQTEQRYGGTGLGLDISQQLSRMHGGELTVESSVGQGSTFSFSLPLAVGEQVAVQSLVAEDRAVVAFDDPVDVDALYSILLVEDDANVRTMIRRMLEHEGYIVVDTNAGGQVVEITSAMLPSAIILDVFLPEKNGWMVLEELKANPETAAIPVIICTVDPDHMRSAALGAAHHLLKPFSAEVLLGAVRHVLANTPVKEG